MEDLNAWSLEAKLWGEAKLEVWEEVGGPRDGLYPSLSMKSFTRAAEKRREGGENRASVEGRASGVATTENK